MLMWRVPAGGARKERKRGWYTQEEKGVDKERTHKYAKRGYAARYLLVRRTQKMHNNSHSMLIFLYILWKAGLTDMEN